MNGNRVVVDLGFGDAGKGTLVDYYCAVQDVSCVVRFSGGAQAAHNVVLPDGRHHTFAQFGSGTLREVPTYLGPQMMVNPLNLMREADALRTKLDVDPLQLLVVNPNCHVTAPDHRVANRVRELARGADRHGSTGQGIGETADLSLNHGLTLYVGDLASRGRTLGKLQRIRAHYVAELGTWPFKDEAPLETVADWFTEIYGGLNVHGSPYLEHALTCGDVIFEGSQGVLLDETRGFHPYTTWTNTTFDNAEALLREQGATATRIGVTRSYATRHGAGPLPTERPDLLPKYPEPHNGTGRFQGEWRVGDLDLQLLKYAVGAAGGVDELAVTHADRWNSDRRVVAGYRSDLNLDLRPQATLDLQRERVTQPLLEAVPDPQRSFYHLAPEALYETLHEYVGAPVTLTSHGPTASDKRALVPA